MAKLPYGGFEIDPPDLTPEEKLHAIQQALRAGECPPPALAQWLGRAIERALQADNTGAALLVALDLKRSAGRPKQYPADALVIWGERMEQLMDAGAPKEAAIAAVQEEYYLAHGVEPSRAQLQWWLQTYQHARNPPE